jgi:hypothetical protein
VSPCIKYGSFLVRLWRQTVQNGLHIPNGWRSEVEHIQSGNTWSFDTLEELDEFLHQQTNGPGEFEWIEIQENEQ